MNVCVSNKSGHKDIKIGDKYELLEHINQELVWVKIPDMSNSVGFRTVQSYISDFKSIEKIRDEKINQLLK